MDEQNITEKLGILREIGEVKIELEKVRGEIKSLVDVKTATHAELLKMLEKHNAELYGNGREGIKTIVDRLSVANTNRRQHYIIIYTALVGLIAKLFVQWAINK